MLPSAAAEILTALVAISETTNSTVSAILPRPHSQTTCLVCSRAHGIALGNAASFRCDRSGQPAVAGAARPLPSCQGSVPRPVIPRPPGSVIRNCPLIAPWLLINVESSGGDRLVTRWATCRPGTRATLTTSRMPMSSLLCKDAYEVGHKLRRFAWPEIVRHRLSGSAVWRLNCGHYVPRPD